MASVETVPANKFVIFFVLTSIPLLNVTTFDATVWGFAVILFKNVASVYVLFVRSGPFTGTYVVVIFLDPWSISLATVWAVVVVLFN